MRILITLCWLFPLPLFAQSWFIEPGGAFRSGIWQYNLGTGQQGIFAEKGLQYSHFAPFLGAYVQGGYQLERFSIGAGMAYTLFFDNELRASQNRRSGTYVYAISDSYTQLFHLFIRGEWYLVSKPGFRLGPSLRAGLFTPTTSFPEEDRLHRRRFVEGGLSCQARLGRPWLHIGPAYQWNSITGKDTDARHHIFSMGILAGLRYSF